MYENDTCYYFLSKSYHQVENCVHCGELRAKNIAFVGCRWGFSISCEYGLIFPAVFLVISEKHACAPTDDRRRQVYAAMFMLRFF